MKSIHQPEMNKIYAGDCLNTLRSWPDRIAHMAVTSPPYFGLRDYGVEDQHGRNGTVQEYVSSLVSVCHELRRVLRDDGTLWLNLGDSYAKAGGKQVLQTKNASHGLAGMRAGTPGFKPKQMLGVPWRVALALQDDGWFLRSDIIWEKPNAMPSSVTDRVTTSHEYIFMLSKTKSYYFDAKSIQEKAINAGKVVKLGAKSSSKGQAAGARVAASGNGLHDSYLVKEFRNKRSVWRVNTRCFKGAHFATFPPDLIEPCVLAGSPVGGVVLDPYMGAGTTALVAEKNGRNFLGCELNPEYVSMALARIRASNATLKED